MRIFGHLTIHWLRRKSPNWRIAAKLQLQPNYKILDIGCDWDGLAVTLSSVEPGISLTGITFSENQHAYATTVVKPKPQARYIHYEHPDYRHQTGHFEKIVSIGRLEHIAATHLNSYFAGIARLLTPNGIFLVHSIGVGHKSRRCNRWINKYISRRIPARTRTGDSRRQPSRAENS